MSPTLYSGILGNKQSRIPRYPTPRCNIPLLLSESLRSHTKLHSHIVTLHVCVRQCSIIGDPQQNIAGKCQGLSNPDRFVIDVLLVVYNKNVGELDYFISS